ncbi:MAG: ribonucleotide reductase N-terminal alpha domain-containing protein [Candidatus Heimdallarchaeota archaeon]
MALSKNAEYLLKDRYARKNETPDDILKRVAAGIFGSNGKKQRRLYNLMVNGIFLPSSPTIKNLGIQKAMLHPCHVINVPDSMTGIMRALSKTAKIFQFGGGVGFNFSQLRPKGSSLNSGGNSSGVVSFMQLFDQLTTTVKQGGFRRGALMGILNATHPEIAPFVTSKLQGTLTNFNISVMVNDDFMQKVTMNNSDDILLEFRNDQYERMKANDLFDLIVSSAYISGDPGLLFYDRINKDNKFYPKKKIEATNPCGEVGLFPDTCCNLGSINLTKFVKENCFDWQGYKDTVCFGTEVLKKINRIAWYPYKIIQKKMHELDICGLGHMGVADTFIMLGMRYDSPEARAFFKQILETYKCITDYYRSNSFYMRSQAPTGSLSILADCSSGIEPVFSRNFERHLTVGVIQEVREIYKSKYCVTAHEIAPKHHLEMQALTQRYTDAAVSKTINLPSNASLADIRRIYIRAWKSGCKGITVFRDQSKEGVLRSKCTDESCYL